MPAYTFQAVDADGRNRTGVLEADSARSVRSQLRAQGFVPLAVGVVEAAGAEAGQRRWRGRAFNSTALAVWTRQLSGLVSAGLPLERALATLAEEMDTPVQRQLVAVLRAEVNSGSTFATAMGQAPREFPAVYRAVIAAGEQGGQLGPVLEQLADDLEEQQQLRNKLIAASLYPAIVSVVALLIVVFLMTYVVPQVAAVFNGTRHALPLLTRVMLGLSTFAKHWGWLVALLGAATFGLLALALRTQSFRLRFDAAWLRLPLIGRLARGYNTARFAATLAMLSGSGVPILRSLQASAETLNNRAMRADALDALNLVREGAPLASALAASKRFPPLLIMFTRLGEQTGNLPIMLKRAAKQVSNDVQRHAMALATILEPLLIVTMGLFVMLIVLAVLMPIIELNQLVK
ncbi:MAG: type II secretion system inner membrane protein GspF [Pseudoxanthomonas sp.]